MSDIKKDITVKVVFDDKTLKNIPVVMSKYGFPKVANSVRKALANYIPQDTKSLIESFYILRDEDDKWSFLAVGSLSDDNKINKVAIAQHENILNHYGTPGKSMRQGAGDYSEGKRWAIHGQSRTIPKEQLNSYHKGYLKLKKDGELTAYKSEYLKKAVEEVINDIAKIISRQKLTEDGNK